MFKLLFELVRKDLRIFIADRRSVIISFLVPTVLAVFIGYMTSSMGQSSSPQKISLLVVDQDHSAFSKALIDKLKAGSSFEVKDSDEANAKSKVSRGRHSQAGGSHSKWIWRCGCQCDDAKNRSP